MTERELQPLRRPQFQTLMVVQKFIDDKEYSPSVREIMDKMNINSSGDISAYMNTLETYGYIARARDKKNRVLAHTTRVLVEPYKAPLDFDPNNDPVLNNI